MINKLSAINIYPYDSTDLKLRGTDFIMSVEAPRNKDLVWVRPRNPNRIMENDITLPFDYGEEVQTHGGVQEAIKKYGEVADLLRYFQDEWHVIGNIVINWKEIKHILKKSKYENK